MSEPIQVGISSEEERTLALIDEAMARRDKRIMGKINDKLETLAQPREESRLPVTPEEETPEAPQPERARPYGTVQTRVATHPLYVRIPEIEKPYRSPESDHYVLQWLNALAARDVAATKDAHERINELYGIGRGQRAPGDPWDVGVIDNVSKDPYTGEGGPLVPFPLVQMIMINRDRMAKIPGLSTAIQLNQMSNRIPRMEAATVAMVAEGAEASSVNPALDELNMTARKMQGHAEVTLECLADSAFNTVGLLSQRMGMSMGQQEDIQAADAGGSGAPNITGNIRAGITYTSIGAAGLTFPDVVALYFGVGQPYRMDGVWYGNAVGLQALTAVNDPTGSYPIFSSQATVPGAIVDDSADGFVFRKPVYEVPITGDTTTNGAGALIFMSRSAYGWGRRAGMTARSSEHSAWARDSVAFKFTQRVDGVLLDPGGSNGASGAGADDFN